MKKERIVHGLIDGEFVDQFDILKEELSMNGAIKVSEASVIKYLLQFYTKAKSNV